MSFWRQNQVACCLETTLAIVFMFVPTPTNLWRRLLDCEAISKGGSRQSRLLVVCSFRIWMKGSSLKEIGVLEFHHILTTKSYHQGGRVLQIAMSFKEGQNSKCEPLLSPFYKQVHCMERKDITSLNKVGLFMFIGNIY